MGILAACPTCHTKQATKNKKCIGWIDKKSGIRCNENLDKAKKNKKVRYYISYYLPGKKLKRESVSMMEDLDGYSIEDARVALAKRKVQKKERRTLDMLPDINKKFSQLTEWHLSQDSIKALAYYKTLKSNLASFNREFGGWFVGDVKKTDLKNFQTKRLRDGHSPAYIDKQIESAKNMVTAALDADEIGGDCLKPFRKLKNLCKKGANARDRILSFQEYESILINLPAHSQGPFGMAFWTGMRASEILKLTWDKIDLANRIIKLEPTDTKEKMPKRIPISKPLRSVLMQIPKRGQQGLVFKYAGKPVKDIRDGLKNACQKSDIIYGRFEKNGFIFHDLRHTFTTNARRAGVHKNVAMAIMGHSEGRDMNRRYDTIDDSDLLEAVQKIENYLQSNHQSNHQEGKNESNSVKNN